MLTIRQEPVQSVALGILKWDESKHVRDAKGQFASKYVPNYEATKEGLFEWPNGRPGPNDLFGPEPVWTQEHRALVSKALQSWVGDPVNFRIHAQDAAIGAPIPPSGSGKQMRAQAEALLWELEHNAQPITIPLYRGSGVKGDRPGSTGHAGGPFSWSENKKIAQKWAKKYGGRVDTLPANTAVGLRLRDYTGDAFGELQWLVRAGNDPLTLKREFNRPHWEEQKHPRHPSGSSEGGRFAEVLHGPKDALDSLLNNEHNVSIDRNDVRTFLDLAGEQLEDPDLTDLQVEGMQIFGGAGLGINRKKMPQIPPEHRQRFLEWATKQGVKITAEMVSPYDLKPTQDHISARRVAQKLVKYEKGKKEFPAVLTSNQDRILDGHHHWGMMAAFALDFPNAKMPIFRLQLSTKQALALMHVYMRRNGLKRKDIAGTVVKKDPVSGRYVTPFVSFDKQGDEQLRMIASLNSSRLATWGFTAEAEVLGATRYKLTAVLDGRTSKFCRMIDGKVFDVSDARRKVIEVLNVQDPEDLRVVQPWPRQTKADMAMYAEMSTEEFVERGLHIPPYHPHCRTLLRHIPSSEGEATEPPVPTVPEDTEVFQPVTAEDLIALGVDASPENVAQWNEYIGMSPTELLSKLTGMPPQEVMTKGQGVGTRPIRFDESGNIGIKAHGATNGLEFQLGAILDPFTGIFYLSEAELLKGTPKAELAFLKNLFSELINTGLKSSATAVAVGVAGNAAYYAKLGFLPDDLEWDSLRTYALTEIETGALKPVLASLKAEDQLLVKQLLQDGSASALSALVELPYTYNGKTIGEWILGEVGGTWALDLTDDVLVAQAQAYLL